VPTNLGREVRIVSVIVGRDERAPMLDVSDYADRVVVGRPIPHTVATCDKAQDTGVYPRQRHLPPKEDTWPMINPIVFRNMTAQ